MSQYRYFAEGQLKVDPTTGTRCRTGQLNHQFVEQKFVGGAWVGIGDNDGVRYGDVAGAGCRFREGMRDGDYVVDVETKVGGFLLAEGDGWVNCGSVEGYWTSQRIATIFEDIYPIAPGSYSDGDHILSTRVGSTAYLTVIDATPGAETFQCPNNDTYKTADTDYVWFNNTDATQRTVSTAELIGYDLQRTPVKYLDDVPNTISIIGILKTGVVVSGLLRDKIFKLFQLPILWDNSLNAYGHVKSNRIGQNLWMPLSHFVMTFDTELAGSATKTVVIPTYSDGYDCVVDWGDGLTDNYVGGTLNTAGTITHVYATTGIKEIRIYGTFPQVYFNNGGDRLKLKTIAQWGNIIWRHMSSAFFGCENLTGTYTDIPDFSLVPYCNGMFFNCYLFNSLVNFNDPLGGTLETMFYNALAFKQSLASFNIINTVNIGLLAVNCDINEAGTTTNYDATLISWAAQNVHDNLTTNFGSSKYSAGAAAAARDHLVTVHGWTITDGGVL